MKYNPSLKKYLLEEPQKPGRLSSDLALRIRSRGEEVKELYESLSSNFDAIFEIYEFSEVLREKYSLRLEYARKLKDPAGQNEKLSEIFGEIRTDIIQSLGLVDADNGLSHEERLELALQFGRRYFGI
ncbi:MAG: hypothetical protein QME12_08540 [Nanoarchaeota archaeon]|nr:hypothetical protein [Nanoarchaeota archaeon]